MLVIRLFRVGKKNQPSFKIVVTEKKNPPRGGRFVEQVGFYNPLTKEKVLNKERIQYWLSKGAQPSDTIHNLLVKEGILEARKIPVHKKPKKKEEKTEEKLVTPAEAEPKFSETKSQPTEPAEGKKKEETPKQEEPKKEEQPKIEEKPKEEKVDEKPVEEEKEVSKPEEGR